MDIRITPRKLSGTVKAPPSCSEAHRKLICAALSAERTPSKVRNVSFSEDVCATLDALKAVGSSYEIIDNSVVFYDFKPSGEVVIDCRESKPTLMFMLPLVCCLYSVTATFTGGEMLLDESLDDLINLLKDKGVQCDYKGKMPFTVQGPIPSGEYYPNSYSNISGLLIALCHNYSDSMVVIKNKDSSHSYPDMTVEVIREAKILTAFANGIYIIRGSQNFALSDTDVGGDFELASNFVVANAISSNIRIVGLDAMSPQSERSIFEIIRNTQSNNCKAFNIDISNYLSLLPILAVYACSLSGTSRISGIKADFIDCTSFIKATCDMINSLGGNARAFTDHIEIEGTKRLRGGVVDSCNDYRIVLAAAILSTMCQEPVVIRHFECIARHYPTFFDDFRRLGGIADISSFN